jgi:hypothetical protein
MGALLLLDVLLKVASLEPGRAVGPVLGVERAILCWAGAQERQNQAVLLEIPSELNLALADEPLWAQGEPGRQARWPEERRELVSVVQVRLLELC